MPCPLTRAAFGRKRAAGWHGCSAGSNATRSAQKASAAKTACVTTCVTAAASSPRCPGFRVFRLNGASAAEPRETVLFGQELFERAQATGGLSDAAYVEALEQVMDVCREITGSRSLNLLGACAGGLTNAALQGHLQAKRQLRKVSSATYLVSLLDSQVESPAMLFADEQTLVGHLGRHTG